MDWQAFWLTIRLAVLVAAILVVIGLPIAYWITYSRWPSTAACRPIVNRLGRRRRPGGRQSSTAARRASSPATR